MVHGYALTRAGALAGAGRLPLRRAGRQCGGYLFGLRGRNAAGWTSVISSPFTEAPCFGVVGRRRGKRRAAGSGPIHAYVLMGVDRHPARELPAV